MAKKINPTRSELINLKKRLKLARLGHDLLKKKRDGLIMEFFEYLKTVKNIRAELIDDYIDAFHKMRLARLLNSDIVMKSVALAVTARPRVLSKKKNIMGVAVPKLEATAEHIKAHDRGFGRSTSVSIEETAISYEKVIDKLLAAAEIEITMKRLLTEIEKTKRQVNALKYAVIPQMEETRAFITLRLEELENENLFRLKMIKHKAEDRANESEEAEA